MTIMLGPPGRDAVHDVCVVGSGPAGLAVALACARQGHSVVVLEAGGDTRDTSPIDAVSVLDQDSHAMLDVSTRVRFGGTSSVWGGLCVPYDPIDFEERPWVPAPAWPLTHEEASRWVTEAGRFLGCGTTFEAPGCACGGADGLDTGQLGRLARRASMDGVYRRDVVASSSMTLCLRTRAVDVACDDAGTSAVGVDAHAGNGLERVRARHVVLAAGGLRSTRMLLALARDRPQPFAAGAAHLGRHYMGHLTGEIATVVFHDPLRAAAWLYGRDADGLWSQRRIKLSPSLQRAHKLLNTAFTVRAPPLNDHRHGDGASSTVVLLASIPGVRRMVRSTRLSDAVGTLRSGDRMLHLRNALRHPRATVRSMVEVIDQLAVENLPVMMLNASGRYSLRYHAEQLPDPRSRVFLDEGDTSRMIVDFRQFPEDVRSILLSHEVLDHELRGAGIGHLEYHVAREGLHESVRAQACDGYHQIGTTRMSGDPRHGVVDGNCRVHGFGNLYVASASVLPTSGSANPTLFTVAMALRLAGHLCAGMGSGAATPSSAGDPCLANA